MTMSKLSLSDISRYKASAQSPALLIKRVEECLSRSLSGDETSFIAKLQDDGFSDDRIFELFSYCRSRNALSIPYMGKVSATWIENNINTAADADLFYNSRSPEPVPDEIYTVYGYFGIESKPTNDDIRILKGWLGRNYGLDLIKIACERTLKQIHEPSFAYANKILENWQAKNLTTPEAVAVSESKYNSGKYPKKKKTASKHSTGTDYDALAKELMD